MAGAPALTARRGWTDFAAGKFQTGAYAFDLAKLGVLGASDRLGLRLAQPLRVEHGGFAMWLPTVVRLCDRHRDRQPEHGCR